MVGHFVLSTADCFVYLGGGLMVKGQIAEAHGVQHDAHTPNVDHKRVVGFVAEHLGSGIGGTATGGGESAAGGVEVAESEVNYFEVVPVVK